MHQRLSELIQEFLYIPMVVILEISENLETRQVVRDAPAEHKASNKFFPSNRPLGHVGRRKVPVWASLGGKYSRGFHLG